MGIERDFDNNSGAGNGLWGTVVNWNPEGLPEEGDLLSFSADCTLNVDVSGLTFNGLTVTNNSTFTVPSAANHTININDGYNFTVDTGATLSIAPDSSHIHNISFAPASDGNCDFVVNGTATLTGNAGWRTGTGTLWHSTLASSAAAAQADLVLNDDLDLNYGAHGDITKLEVFVEATDGVYTRYDQDFIAADGYNAGTNTITLAANHDYLHDAEDDPNAGDHKANVYIVTRNVQIKSSTGFGWRLTGAGIINATETQFVDSYRSNPTNENNSWTRCTFTNLGIGNTYAFLGLALQTFTDCLFYRCYVTFQNPLNRVTCNGCHAQGHSRFTIISNKYVVFNGGVCSGQVPQYDSTRDVFVGVEIRATGSLGRIGITLINCKLYDYGAPLGYPGARILLVNCLDDLGLGIKATCEGAIFNANQVEGIHQWYEYGSLIQKLNSTSIARTGRSYCLEVDPYSDLSPNAYLRVPISKKKVEGGHTYTLTVYAAADSTYGTGSDPKVLICPGGANATEQELTIDITSADATKDGNNANDTWASVTSANIVVSGSAGEYYPIWVYVLVPGDAGLLFLDWEWSDNSDPGLENWPLNVIGAAAAGGGVIGGPNKRGGKQ